MKRLSSIVLVLAAHVLVITVMIGGCPEAFRLSTSSDRASSAGQGGQRSEESSSSEALGTANDNDSSANEQGDPRQAPANSEANRLKEETFDEVAQTLPSDLAERAARIPKAGVVIDWTARKVLWSKNESEVLPIASLTKMMTSLLVAERVETAPDWSWDREIPVTESAWKIGGSQVWLDPREVFTVEELLKATLIFSANDAAYLLAEATANGNVSEFVSRMNRKARQLGLSGMRFANPHGLPESQAENDNHGTALEVAFLAAQLMDVPRIVKYTSTRLDWLRQDTDQPLQLLNRNPLVVAQVPGVNGMKTGFTARAGFCIAATSTREQRSLIVVLLGCERKDNRNDLVRDLLEWGYSTGTG
ncbi:MAG: D-alanyl-D-alanine carboxypeptidase family protein [Verrucomicrobiota bacterium]